MEAAGKKKCEKYPGKFEATFDFETRRASYNDKFHDHYSQNLGFIAGVLDMIFILSDSGRLEDVDKNNLNWVILDARNKVEELMENL